MSGQTSRRALLGALALVPAAVGAVALLPSPAAAAPVEEHEDADWHDGVKLGESLALDHMARAWIDRWKAAGGFFGQSWDADGNHQGVGIGWLEYGWTPEDYRTSPLPPHVTLYDKSHAEGARRVLQALLEMVPGLSDAVHESGAAEVLAQGRA